MPALLLCGSRQTTVAANSPCQITSLIPSGSTDPTVAYKQRIAGTYSFMAASVDATGTGRQLFYQVNTGGGFVTGNEVCNFPDSAASYTTDSTHTDHNNVGDLIDFANITVTGT